MHSALDTDSELWADVPSAIRELREDDGDDDDLESVPKHWIADVALELVRTAGRWANGEQPVGPSETVRKSVVNLPDGWESFPRQEFVHCVAVRVRRP
jgi:hypothetical protein